MTMVNMPTLTGLSEETLDKLELHKPTTLVLRSTQNVTALLDASPGDLVFLTSRSGRDLSRNEQGLVAEITSKEITMQRHYRRSGPYEEEHETAVAQIQLVGEGTGRITDITDRFRDLATEGDVDTEHGPMTAF